jgi:hypothetical protein
VVLVPVVSSRYSQLVLSFPPTSFSRRQEIVPHGSRNAFFSIGPQVSVFDFARLIIVPEFARIDSEPSFRIVLPDAMSKSVRK